MKDGSKPATGDVVEGTTTVTYVYEEAGQVVVNYQTEDGTPLVGVDTAGANVASGAKRHCRRTSGSGYNTTDNDMKPLVYDFRRQSTTNFIATATKVDVETGKDCLGETKEVQPTFIKK